MKRLISIAVILLLPTFALAQDFCKGDFNYDGSVASDDVQTFLDNTGRNIYNDPCPPDGPAPVAKTGQRTSYIPGDDGDLEKGVALSPATPRFTDNDNGTVTDHLTGLMWQQSTQSLSSNFPQSVAYCGQLTLAEYDDWRLPNLREQMSLFNYNYHQPALSNAAGTGQHTNGNPFIFFEQYLWTSTSNIDNVGYAWYVNIDSGSLDYEHKGVEMDGLCVRGGH